MFERVRVYALIAAVHHVVRQVRVAARGNFEGLVATCRGNDGVRRCDGRNNIFHDALSERIRHSWDLEFCGAAQGFVVEPCNVLRVVGVEDFVFALLFPCYDVGPFDAVLWLSRDCGQCAEGDCCSRGVHV